LQIEVAVNKTAKYAHSGSGDSAEVVERPKGGISALIADGQGSGRSAKLISNLVISKATALIADGTRDGAVARATHDFLFALRDGKVSATLTIISADLLSRTIVISRNSNCPVLVKKEGRVDILNDPVEPIGFHHFMKPVIHEIPLTPDTMLLTFTDGILHAGRSQGKKFDFDSIVSEFSAVSPWQCAALTDRMLEKAMELDNGRASDDMTVLAMGVHNESCTNIGKLRVTYPVHILR
jgi:serine phosphatase RsbU (regulator of sigma subunit)